MRLTCKLDGTAVSERLPDGAAARRTARGVGELRNFQRLAHEFVEVNAGICRLRPVDEEALGAQKGGTEERIQKGVTESGCKTAIASWLKPPGMLRTNRGANAIVALRCGHLNGQFEDYREARRAV
jgi:hypothetical protein